MTYPDLGALGPVRLPFQFGRLRATYADFARHRRDTPRDRDRFLSMTPRGIVAGETWAEAWSAFTAQSDKHGLSGDMDALRPRAYLFARHSDGATLHVTSRCEIRSGWLTSALTVYAEPPDDEFSDTLGRQLRDAETELSK